MFNRFLFLTIGKYFPMTSILILSTDEMIFSIHLITKDISHLSDYLALTYTIGILVGSVFWRILVSVFSTRFVIVFTQIGLTASTAALLFCAEIKSLFVMKFLQGFLVVAPIMCINVFAKTSLKAVEFNRFLAITQVCAPIVEGFTPAISQSFSKAILSRVPGLDDSFSGAYAAPTSIIFCLIYILAGVPYAFLNRNYSEKRGFASAVSWAFKGYRKMLASYLLIPLLVISITNGIVDVFLLHIESDPNVIVIAYPFISIGSFIAVTLTAYFSKSEESKSKTLFDWTAGVNNCDKWKIYLALFAAIASLFLLVSCGNNKLRLVLFSTIFIAGINVINYLCTKSLYCIYQSNASVASSIVLGENLLSCLMQGGYNYFFTTHSAGSVIKYLSGYTLFAGAIVVIFYFRLDSHGKVIKDNVK